VNQLLIPASVTPQQTGGFLAFGAGVLATLTSLLNGLVRKRERKEEKGRRSMREMEKNNVLNKQKSQIHRNADITCFLTTTWGKEERGERVGRMNNLLNIKTVPNAPINTQSNIVFFFNSLEGATPGGSGSDILQPVLQVYTTLLLFPFLSPSPFLC
jgi:hypothetical protein